MHALITDYFQIANTWSIIGDFSTVLFLLGIASVIYLHIKNATPLFLRLPNPKTKKIAIITEDIQHENKFKFHLNASGLFNSGNITTYRYSQISDFKGADLLIFDWENFKQTKPDSETTTNTDKLPDELQRLLDCRKESAAVLFFAAPGSIPKNIMQHLSEQSNVSISNFLGRLVSDVLINLLASQTGK